MILDISNSEFKKLFEDKKLFLPIRWDGYDFLHTLNGLFDYYIKKLDLLPDDGHDIRVDTEVVKRACGLLSKAVSHYLNGFPSKAYSSFERSMNIFMGRPLRIYQKSVTEQFEDRRNYRNNDDSLKLFRVLLSVTIDLMEENVCFIRHIIFALKFLHAGIVLLDIQVCI